MPGSAALCFKSLSIEMARPVITSKLKLYPCERKHKQTEKATIITESVCAIGLRGTMFAFTDLRNERNAMSIAAT